MTTNRPLRVFLCHSSNDKPAVRELYKKLLAEPWIQPWLDEEELYPGQDWNMEIEKAVEAADAIIVCLSNNSINKKGYVQKELRFALDIALEMPEETIFILPLRLEECTPPRSLRDWQYADYFEGKRENAHQRLLVSLKRRADSLGLKFEEIKPIMTFEEAKPSLNEKRLDKGKTSTAELKIKQPKIPNAEWIKENKIIISNGMEFMCVPKGKFLMGSQEDNKLAHRSEKPQHTIDIPYDYWMARFPVTNKLYSAYAYDIGIKHPADGWFSSWGKKEDHPVYSVKWTDAMAYCQWLNNLLKAELSSGLVLRLPSEAEWEKAARSTDGREYPWGNIFDKNKCNASELTKERTTPVSLYSPRGDSPYGCADMVGNVWEWTHSLYRDYPYKVDDGREDEMGTDPHILRGGATTTTSEWYTRCTPRLSDNLPYFHFNLLGFRVVLAPPLPK